MTCAVFGGTFNPVHNSHLIMAEYVNNMPEVDKLLIIPDNIPPHKAVKNLASGVDRLKMCELAFSGLNKAEISGMELEREGASYTVDTLNELRNKYDKLYLVCGGDMVETFHLWSRYKEILSIATIIAFTRDGKKDGDFKKGIENIKNAGGKVIVADISVPSLSSTEIRSGAEFSKSVPTGVAEYIELKGLYK